MKVKILVVAIALLVLSLPFVFAADVKRIPQPQKAGINSILDVKELKQMTGDYKGSIKDLALTRRKVFEAKRMQKIEDKKKGLERAMESGNAPEHAMRQEALAKIVAGKEEKVRSLKSEAKKRADVSKKPSIFMMQKSGRFSRI